MKCKSIKFKRLFLIIVIAFVLSVSVYAEELDVSMVMRPKELLENTIKLVVSIFDNNVFKVIACLFLIGEAIALFFAGSSGNVNVFRKILPWFIGSMLFMLAGVLTSVIFEKNIVLLGDSKLPNFDHLSNPLQENGQVNSDYSILNLPLVEVFTSFDVIFTNIRDTLLSLCVIFCFLNFIFAAFKLWSGTIELKKVYVDVIYKVLLVLTLCAIYPTVQEKVFQLGTSIGMNASNAHVKMEADYLQVFKYFRDDFITATGPFIENIKKTTDSYNTSFGTVYKYADLKNKGMTEEEIREFATTTGATIIKRSWYQIDYRDLNGNKLSGSNKEIKAKNKVKGHTFPGVETTLEDGSNAAEQYFQEYRGRGMSDLEAYNAVLNDSRLYEPYKEQFIRNNEEWLKNTEAGMTAAGFQENQRKLSLAKVKIKAMLEVIAGKEFEELEAETWDYNKVKKIFQENVDNLYLNMYLVAVNDKGQRESTYVLAPAKIIKIINVYDDVIVTALGKTVSNTGDIDDFKVKSIFASLKEFVVRMLYFLLSRISLYYLGVAYTMMTAEYLLVTSLAVLLIPFFFLDSVKSYAQNIIGLFIKYLFKYIIVSTVLFWALSMFMLIKSTGFNADEIGTSNWFLNQFLSMATVTSIVLLSEKMANTLISGSPSVGAGDLKQQVQSAAHTAGKIGGAGMDLAFGKRGADGKRHGGIRGGIQSAHNTLGNTVANFRGARQGQKELLSSRADQLQKSWAGDKTHEPTIARKDGSTVSYSNATKAEQRQEAMRQAEKEYGGVTVAGFKAVGQQAGQAIGDKWHHAITGQDAQHRKFNEDGTETTTGTLKQGQNFFDEHGRQHTATRHDVFNEARNRIARMNEQTPTIPTEKHPTEPTPAGGGES